MLTSIFNFKLKRNCRFWYGTCIKTFESGKPIKCRKRSCYSKSSKIEEPRHKNQASWRFLTRNIKTICNMLILILIGTLF